MNPELGSNPRNSPDPKLMLPTELLEQIHSGVPIHSEPPGKAGDTLGLRDGSWAKIRQHYWAKVGFSRTSRAVGGTRGVQSVDMTAGLRMQASSAAAHAAC